MVHRFTIGVVVGDRNVLVIDSGMGLGGSLRHYVEHLTGKEKPIICVVTHNHPDHAGGAITFDKAYCSFRDYPARNDFAFDTRQRLMDLEGFCMDNREVVQYCRAHYLDNTETVFWDVRDGDVFDLGGVVLTAIAVPGHSPGSMALYNSKERYVFTGDAINTDVHLKKLDREGILQYKKTLERFLSIVGEDVLLYPAHLPLVMDIKVVKSLIKCCDELAEGETETDPPGETIFKNRANNPDIRMHYSGNACIVYNRRLMEPAACGGNRGHFCIFSHEQISDHVYIVTENYSMVHRLTVGVIIGTDKILVIDSGLGMGGNLRRYIEAFAGGKKPVECACTHGHCEHIGGAAYFDKAYLNHGDYPLLQDVLQKEHRLRLLGALSLGNKEMIEFGRRNLKEPNAAFTDVRPGDRMDLGGVEVEALALPGHSEGHLAYYCKKESVVFTGDAVNVDVRLKNSCRSGILEYADTLQEFLARLSEDVRIFAGHTNRPLRIRVLENLIRACKEVAEGDTRHDPPGAAVFPEYADCTEFRMHYHGNSCIVYDETLIRM